jgi:hypothetical protein
MFLKLAESLASALSYPIKHAGGDIVSCDASGRSCGTGSEFRRPTPARD